MTAPTALATDAATESTTALAVGQGAEPEAQPPLQRQLCGAAPRTPRAREPPADEPPTERCVVDKAHARLRLARRRPRRRHAPAGESPAADTSTELQRRPACDRRAFGGSDEGSQAAQQLDAPPAAKYGAHDFEESNVIHP